MPNCWWALFLVPIWHPTCDPAVGNNSWALVICGSPKFTCVVCLSFPSACQSLVHCPYLPRLIETVGDMDNRFSCVLNVFEPVQRWGYKMQNEGSEASIKLQIYNVDNKKVCHNFSASTLAYNYVEMLDTFNIACECWRVRLFHPAFHFG